MKTRHSANIFYCFSPPVMVATFILETFMAGYTIYRYKLNQTGRIILGLIVNLGLFQIAEYFVCTHTALADIAARCGFAAITFLPPLAYYLMTQLTQPLQKRVILLMFTVSAGLVTYFLLSSQAFNGYQCTGNYVIFQIGTIPTFIYGTFYFGLIAISMIKGAHYLRYNPDVSKKSKLAVLWLLAGYMVFILPVAGLVVLQPDTRKAVPSLMCGFAVSMAIILAARVAPLTLKKYSHFGK